MILTKISNRLLIITTAFALILLTTVFASNSSLDPYAIFDNKGDVSKASGEISFLQGTNKNKVHVIGQLNSGLTVDDKSAYSFLIMDTKGKLFSNETDNVLDKLTIVPPGGSPFEYDTNDYDLEDLVGLNYVIKRYGKVIGDSKLVKP